MSPFLPARRATRRRRSVSPSNAGFTLIEVLVALVILATGIVLVMQAFGSALTAMGESRSSLEATGVLARVLADTEAAIRDGETFPGYASGRSSGGVLEFQWERRVTERAAAEGSRLLEVVATVWREGSLARYSTTSLLAVPPPPKP